MRRLMASVIVVLFVLSIGVSYAQEGQRPMPNKVRNFLDNIVGTWNVDSELMDVTVVFEWEPGNNFIIGRAQGKMKNIPFSDAGFWYWDGVSKDGVIISWVAPDAYSTIKCRILSKTLMEGNEKGVLSGKELISNSRIEIQGSDKLIMEISETTVGGEENSDWNGVYTYSRVKASTREDFNEYCKLNQGRWVGDVTWSADIPGMGKKGDKVTAYYEGTVAEDGNVLIEKFYAGDGSSSGFTVFDTSTNNIITTWISSSGIVSHQTIYKVGGKWIVKETGCNPDGTKTKSDLTMTYSEDGKQLIVTGSGTIGNEKTDDIHNVWRRLSK